jgi:DNA-binding MarR family transcriptional regulator
VLHLIEPGRAVSMGELASALACDASNVTGLVDRLETRGLVRRTPSEHDRRVKVISLTPGGVRVRTVFIQRLTAPPEALGRLSPAEQRTLMELLARVLE